MSIEAFQIIFRMDNDNPKVNGYDKRPCIPSLRNTQPFIILYVFLHLVLSILHLYSPSEHYTINGNVRRSFYSHRRTVWIFHSFYPGPYSLLQTPQGHIRLPRQQKFPYRSTSVFIYCLLTFIFCRLLPFCSSGSYLAAAIPFTPIFSVPLSLYGRTSR